MTPTIFLLPRRSSVNTLTLKLNTWTSMTWKRKKLWSTTLLFSLLLSCSCPTELKLLKLLRTYLLITVRSISSWPSSKRRALSKKWLARLSPTLSTSLPLTLVKSLTKMNSLILWRKMVWTLVTWRDWPQKLTSSSTPSVSLSSKPTRLERKIISQILKTAGREVNDQLVNSYLSANLFIKTKPIF